MARSPAIIPAAVDANSQPASAPCPRTPRARTGRTGTPPTQTPDHASRGPAAGRHRGPCAPGARGRAGRHADQADQVGQGGDGEQPAGRQPQQGEAADAVPDHLHAAVGQVHQRARQDVGPRQGRSRGRAPTWSRRTSRTPRTGSPAGRTGPATASPAPAAARPRPAPHPSGPSSPSWAGTRSEDASSNCDTTRETSGPPNSDSPLSTADRVAWYVIVASASPDAATEITTTQRLTNRARNSPMASSDRYVGRAVVAGIVRSC